MTHSDKDFDLAFHNLASDVITAIAMENSLNGKAPPKPHISGKRAAVTEATEFMALQNPVTILKDVLSACKRQRAAEQSKINAPITNKELNHLATFTDKFKLAPYARFLNYVPRLVNCVTLAEAVPVPGTDTLLPFDLHRIAAMCPNSYHAPRKFSAVQLAYSEPRCRVLVFREYGDLNTFQIVHSRLLASLCL